jgi:hypothetical protein
MTRGFWQDDERYLETYWSRWQDVWVHGDWAAIDDDGQWTVRNDVWYQEARIGFSGSPLSPTSNGRTIGPELGFGHVMGTYHDEQVLLIKTAMGNRALGYDFRPPSSGRNDPDSKWEGLEYRLMVEGVRKTLDQMAAIVPGYNGQGYEIAGFAWWQGDKDRYNAVHASRYEQNLVQLIKTLRKDFDAPNAKFVCATLGQTAKGAKGAEGQILEAQFAVDGKNGNYPGFKGNIATVYSKPFCHGGASNGHYGGNAETYMDIGEAMGQAMAELLGTKTVSFKKLKPYLDDVTTRQCTHYLLLIKIQNYQLGILTIQ